MKIRREESKGLCKKVNTKQIHTSGHISLANSIYINKDGRVSSEYNNKPGFTYGVTACSLHK